MDAVEYLRAFYKMCDSNKYCSSCEAIGVCQNDCEKAEQMVEIVEELKNIPSAQPERKTGRWIIYEISLFDGEDVKCSECGQCGCAPYWDFCPNCGAKMDGGGDDGNG